MRSRLPSTNFGNLKAPTVVFVSQIRNRSVLGYCQGSSIALVEVTDPKTVTSLILTKKDRFHYELPLLRYSKIQDIADTFLRHSPFGSSTIPSALPALPRALSCWHFSRTSSLAIAAHSRKRRRGTTAGEI